ncbi:MAG: hypothetical protein IJT78_01140 [Oscillospiraceae bacterium]|nr:hypothetical protein [Oscillospiraceae bacterium]
MELKLLSDEERLLFEKDAFADVPPLVTAQGETHPVEERGDCFFQLTNYVNIEEYHAYLQTVESAGWQLIVRYDGIPIPADNITLFRKDRRLLEVIYYDFQNHAFLNPKLYVSVSLVPPYRIREPGDLFRDVALPEAQPARDCGEGNFIALTENAARSEYDALLAAVCRDGWGKQYDNGAGLADAVFTALFTKDTRTLCALYTAPSHRLYVTVGEEQAPPSPYLTDDPARRGGFVPGLRTSLHMLELWHFGNSFVIQLKNGHFLVSDGGLRQDVPYLVDYLEQLAPAGEKPVIEGWFISHGHGDHCGVLMELALNGEWGERITVEGVYFSQPSVDMLALDHAGLGSMGLIHRMPDKIRTAAGVPTPFYRLRTGERYYFADITVDVLLAQELIPFESCTGDLNDTSAWLLFTVEGQKILLAGDGDKSGMKLLMENYTSAFMAVDVMSVLHHGSNVRNEFTDFCSVKTALYPCYDTSKLRKKEQNDYLKSKVAEWFAWGDGTRVLTFPYRVGESVRIPPRDWKYHRDETRPVGSVGDNKKRE